MIPKPKKDPKMTTKKSAYFFLNTMETIGDYFAYKLVTLNQHLGTDELGSLKGPVFPAERFVANILINFTEIISNYRVPSIIGYMPHETLSHKMLLLVFQFLLYVFSSPLL